MGDGDRGGIVGDEDRLPWLEAVEDEDERGVGAGKLVAAVIAALVALGLVVGGVFWMRQKSAPQGDGTLIAAPAGDYKVAPNASDANAAVEGEGDATYAASQGANVSSTIDTTRIPEAPVKGGVTASDATGSKALPPPGAPVAPVKTAAAAPVKAPAPIARPEAPKPAAPKEIAKTEPAKAPPKPAAQAKTTTPAEASRGAPPTAAATPAESASSAGGLSKQIGAYSSKAKADTASADLTSRFPALHGLSLSIRSGDSKGKTVYRIFMKGSAPKVEAVCKALHSAKEGCIPG